MSEVEYAVIPGEVMSRNDGDIHWVGAGKLMALYGVPRSACVVVREDRNERVPDGLIPLRTRYDGDYSLPEENPDD